MNSRAFTIIAAAGCAPGGYYNTSQTALDSLLTTQAEMMRRVGALERKMDAAREGLQATRANSEAKMAEISQRLDVLGGQLEESGARVTRLAQGVDTVKHRLLSADSARAGARVDTSETPDPEAMYQAAYSDVAAGRYNLAREAFQTYLKYFSDTEVADNAQYWIGECYYSKGRYNEAVAAWEDLLRDYPASDKIPDARYKKAVTLERLGRRREALVEYRNVVERYPNSEAGRKAREKLNP